LAESWLTPDKGKTWVFTLREDIFWQDGEKVESSDISYEFSDVTLERPDGKTIIFKLKDSFSHFPTVVSKPVFRRGLLGTGEWEVKKVKVSGNFVQEIVLEDANAKRRIYKFYPTEQRTKLAFKLGEVDILQQVFDPQPFTSWKTVQVKSTPNIRQIVTIFFNTEDRLLSDKSYRQALTYAIEKESLSNKRAISPIQPGSWAYNPQVKTYGYDVSRAKELIEELDSELKDGLNIKLVSAPVLLPIAEEIAGFWQEIGVDAVVQVSSVIPSEFQAYLAIFETPVDPDQYSMWHSTQKGTNITHYTDPRIDKLLEDGRSELEIEERRKIYLDFQRFLVEDSPAAFLYHPATYTITRR